MNKSTLILVSIFILLLGNVFFGFKYFSVAEEARESEIVVATHTINEKILDFTKFFIAKVLKAEKEVDFETRLKLENEVRDLGDQEILAEWTKFIESTTEDAAQRQVKNLLEMLINKIEV